MTIFADHFDLLLEKSMVIEKKVEVFKGDRCDLKFCLEMTQKCEKTKGIRINDS